MKHNLRISVSKKPKYGGIVSCRSISVRERLLRFMLGSPTKLTIVVPGDMERDERTGMIEEYLNALLPDDWSNMDVFARRNYLNGCEFGSPDHSGNSIRTEVSNAEIWCECFGKNLQELKPSDSYAIAAIMAQIPGWERASSTRRQPIYGKQRI